MQPGGLVTIQGTGSGSMGMSDGGGGGNILPTNTDINTNGQSTNVHTSCSQPLFTGMNVGCYRSRSLAARRPCSMARSTLAARPLSSTAPTYSSFCSRRSPPFSPIQEPSVHHVAGGVATLWPGAVPPDAPRALPPRAVQLA